MDLSVSKLNRMEMNERRKIESKKGSFEVWLRRIPGGFLWEYMQDGILKAVAFVSVDELMNE